ncbi:MAG: RidA family protein [Eubacteriales bacterium]|nr:RidA family protein [Eubacteriales bacterium]
MAIQKEVLHTELAPAAVGPYSQAIAANGVIYTSGQVPIDPKEGKIVAETIEEQAEQVMQNLKAVLAQGGVGFDRVVKTTCFLADMNDFAAFNGVYAKYFPENAPARSCVQVAALPLGAKVEVEVIAVQG